MKNGLNSIFPISRSSLRSRSLDCSPCNPIIARYPVMLSRPDQRLNGFFDFAIRVLAALCRWGKFFTQGVADFPDSRRLAQLRSPASELDLPHNSVTATHIISR